MISTSQFTFIAWRCAEYSVSALSFVVGLYRNATKHRCIVGRCLSSHYWVPEPAVLVIIMIHGFMTTRSWDVLRESKKLRKAGCSLDVQIRSPDHCNPDSTLSSLLT